MATYWEKLRDPRWQKRRLEIMSRAEFKCELCEAIDKTLNVHHKLYRKGASPWEYEDFELACLCEDCHERVHGIRQKLDSILALMSDVDLEQVLGYAIGMMMFQDVDNMPRITLQSYYAAKGISDVVHYRPMDAEEILNSRAEDGTISAKELAAIYLARSKE